MKSRIFMSMLVIALAAALVGGATMSIFTAQGETDEKTYAAGTVKLSVSDLESSTTIDIKNMAPGDTINGEFVVKNTGSLPLWFQVTAVTKEVEGSENNYLFGGGTPAEVTIDNPAGILESGKEATIYYSVYLPLEADNWYQNAEGILLFKVNAEQFGRAVGPQ
jgi:predicted ribosomally synthesized peptide with SipW-like signal peptide